MTGREVADAGGVALGRWFKRIRKHDGESARQSPPAGPTLEITITQGGRTVATKNVGGTIAIGMQYSAYVEYGATDERTLEVRSRYAQELMRENKVDDAVADYQEIVALRSSTPRSRRRRTRRSAPVAGKRGCAQPRQPPPVEAGEV